MDPGFQLFPDRASTLAEKVDHLALFQLAVTAFFTLLILCLIAYFVLRYRRPMRDMHLPNPPATPSAVWLEITWTVIPWAIAMVMFVWGAKVYVEQSTPPAGATEIHVIGKQWMWQVQHENGRREINALTVPLGRPVTLVMTSQDVIHDFGLPAFRIKQDVLPGRYSYEWFEATKLGEFHIFCQEYCGTGHSTMIGTVRVLKPADYARWLADLPEGDESPAVVGWRLYGDEQFKCASCHGSRAPSLAGVYGSRVEVILPDGTEQTVTADHNYLRESILFPRAKIVKGPWSEQMPSYQGRLTEEQLASLIAYIKSLGPGGHPPDVGQNMREAGPARGASSP